MFVLRLVTNGVPDWDVDWQQYCVQQAIAMGRGAEFSGEKTVRRWAFRMRTHGHAGGYKKQGNVRASILRGADLFRLSIFKRMFPRSTAAETNAFLWNSSSDPPGQRRLYSPSQISAAEDCFQLSMKVSSTAAQQALLPINIQKRWNFWNLPYPFGRADIATEDLIDLDEARIFVETEN